MLAPGPILQAMLQGILQGAGPIGYYPKLSMGVLLLDFSFSVLAFCLQGRFIPGFSFLRFGILGRTFFLVLVFGSLLIAFPGRFVRLLVLGVVGRAAAALLRAKCLKVF